MVGTLQIIVNPLAGTTALDEDEVAYYYEQDGVLYLETPVALGGVQVNMAATDKDNAVAASALTGMEQLSAQVSEEKRIFLAYSMSGKVLPAGTYALLALGEEVEASELVLSTPRGNNVRVLPKDDATAAKFEIAENKQLDNTKGIYDLSGRKLKRLPKQGIVIVNGKVISL